MSESAPKITSENFEHTILSFRDRQAGIGLVFDPFEDRFFYNAYCIEKKLCKELYSCEYEFLEDAINVINAEFGSWEAESLEESKKGCGNCAAKR